VSRLWAIALLALAVWACSPNAAGTPTPEPTGLVTGPSAAPTPRPTSVVSGPSALPAQSSGACVDVGALADVGEPVEIAMTALSLDLKASDLTKARADAMTASSRLRSIADFVRPVRPDAATLFRNAADTVDSAATAFPGGLTLVDQAKTTLEQGFQLARTAACPG